MHTVWLRRWVPVWLLVASTCSSPPAEYDAERIHQEAWVWDAHVDTPNHIHLAGHDIGRWADSSQVDLPKMDKGGLDGGFFAVFVYPSEVPQPRMAAYVSEVITTFVKQVARYVGATVATVRSWEKSGKLTPMKVGRKVRFSRQEIDDLMASAALPVGRFVFRDRRGDFRSANLDHETVAEIASKLAGLDADESVWKLALPFWTREWT